MMFDPVTWCLRLVGHCCTGIHISASNRGLSFKIWLSPTTIKYIWTCFHLTDRPIQTWSTWQWIMWVFKWRPAIVAHKFAMKDLCWPFRAKLSHMRALSISITVVGSQTSTRVMPMLLRITQIFPSSETKATASKDRELPRWRLLSMNLVHNPLSPS